MKPLHVAKVPREFPFGGIDRAAGVDVKINDHGSCEKVLTKNFPFAHQGWDESASAGYVDDAVIAQAGKTAYRGTSKNKMTGIHFLKGKFNFVVDDHWNRKNGKPNEFLNHPVSFEGLVNRSIPIFVPSFAPQAYVFSSVTVRRF